jgi:formamidopyrimidine-DNA glycosylase
MPELPEAETMVRDIARRLIGRTVSDLAISYAPIIAGDPEEFRRIVVGRRLEGARRLGKRVLLVLSGGAALTAHLKMTGQFVLGDWPGSGDESWPPHGRAAFLLTGEGSDVTLFYRDIRKFGRLSAFEADGLEEHVRALGLAPDPFEISKEEFHRRLGSKKAALKAVLLDQRNVVSGLGNIYVDESLFAAGLSPHRSADEIDRVESDALLEKSKAILGAAIKLRGSTVENYQGLDGAGSYQKRHKVYGRSGKPCPRCGKELVKSFVGGRSSVHCPVCQK